jgi:hypothetical protein
LALVQREISSHRVELRLRLAAGLPGRGSRQEGRSTRGKAAPGQAGLRISRARVGVPGVIGRADRDCAARLAGGR